MSSRQQTHQNETGAAKERYVACFMTFADLPQVMALEAASFSDPWPEVAFVQAIASARCHAIVVRSTEERVLGFLIGYVDGPELHIADLAVSPDHRRCGIGRILMRDVLGDTSLRCSSAVLDVRESNRAAIKLYESLGFRLVGRRPGYYRHPVEDALVMRAPIRQNGA